MPEDVERLAILIEANTKAYENALARVEGRTRAALAKVEKQYAESGAKVDGFMSKIGGRMAGFVSVAGAAAAVSGFKKMVDGLSDIADAAERAGVSTDFLQAIGFKVQLA